MDQFFKTEKELLQGIIDRKGDCISAAWCMMCPFQAACITKAINKAKLLPQEERLKRAAERLFDTLMEEELDDEEKEEEEISKDSDR